MFVFNLFPISLFFAFLLIFSCLAAYFSAISPDQNFSDSLVITSLK